MRRRQRVVGWLLVAAAAAAATCACGAAPSNLAGNDPEGIDEDDDKWLRIRGFEDARPPGEFTRALRDLGRGALDAILGMVEHFEDVVKERNCYLQDVDWEGHIKDYVERRGWKEPSNGCVSSTVGTREKELRFSAEEVFNRLRRLADFNNMVKKTVYERTAKRISEKFNHLVTPRSFEYEQGQYQVCTIERATAIRALIARNEAQWYLLHGVTNEAVSKTLPDWERKYITEFVGVSLEQGIENATFIDPLWQKVKPVPTTSGTDQVGDESDNKPRALYHTFLEKWSGRTLVSGMYSMEMDDSPALQQSLRVTDRDVQQAKDALTPSNIAILSLPMFMNLIPISCLMEASSTGVLVFTLLSDVLTTVPFIIKGFELVSMGSRRTVREETYFTDNRSGDFLILETWVADCRLKDVRTYGSLFIVVGFAVLALGVFCEFQAARLRRRWTKGGVLVLPGKREIFSALLGRDGSSDCDETNLPFFDPDDEAAAFKAQQQAELARSSGSLGLNVKF